MEAKERSFIFMDSVSYYDIPFFQRTYVWDEDNWAELLNNFLDHSESHFLGSLILKQEQTRAGDPARFMVIDGQQRLTTLSILLRACYDRLMEDPDIYDEEVVKGFERDMRSLLFIKPSKFTPKEDVKICHSKLDKPYYEAVIRGDLSDYLFKDIDPRAKDKNLSKLERCYFYFRDELHNCCNEDIQTIWNLLTTDTSKFLVNIDLDVNENEQKIFDTVNSFGVRLSSSDTIKNALFQYYIDALRNSGEQEVDKAASSLYDDTWGKAFEVDDETSAYWAATKRYGRLTRDNIEVLLQSFAVITGFFDPSSDNIDSLAQKFKDRTKGMKRDDLESFMVLLRDYAEVYKDNFNIFDANTSLSFDDHVTRILHLCYALDVATFYPYILKLLYQDKKEIGFSGEKTKELLLQLERYIVLNAICKGSTKNYNNECVQLVRERRTPKDLIGSSAYIGRRAFDEGLRSMRNNKIPSAILFWVELHDRFTKYSDIKELKYVYTLEHIMPQKWQINWPVSSLPVYSEKGYEIKDIRDAEEERGAAVYEIGNMTLLNSKLNTSLSNNTFEKKVNGEGNKYKHCMKDLADLYLTRDVVKESSWDERNIRVRTSEIQEKIEEIWNIEFEEDKPIHLEINHSNTKESYDASFPEGTEYEDILYGIEHSDLSDDEKCLYKKCLFEDIINSFEGGYSWENDKRILSKEEREMLESIAETTYPYLASALLAADDGDVQKCIDNYKKMFISGEHGFSETITELGFIKYVVAPICDLFPGFYTHLLEEIKDLNIETEVTNLCIALDAFYEEDDFDNQISVLTKGLDHNPEDTNLNAIIGDVFYAEKEWASAIDHFEKCIEKEDLYLLSETDLLDNLSHSLQKDSPKYNLEESIDVCKKRVDIEPTSEIYARLGHALYLLNYLDDSIEAFKMSLDLDNTNISAANDLAKAYAFSKRLDELQSFISNPPVSLRKYTLEIAEKALAQAGDTEKSQSEISYIEAPDSWGGVRRRYWEYALQLIKETHGPNGAFKNVSTSKEYWINSGIGISGFYLTCEAKADNAGVCISLTNGDREKNKSAFDYLFSRKSEIEAQFGNELKWWRLDDKKASYVSYYENDVSINDESSWTQMAEFHAKWSKKLYDALVPYLKEWNSMN